MQRFFDYPPSLLSYFEAIDSRFAADPPAHEPANVTPTHRAEFTNTRAVLWDVYGTLFGVKLGDLEQGFTQRAQLTPAAAATIDEFNLTAPLRRLSPHREPPAALVDMYLARIEQSHAASRAANVEYPEVLIERIWKTILDDLRHAGWQSPAEDIEHTAYKCAYFFDSAVQRMHLYLGMAETLLAVKRTGAIQGIISNAQFYTPIHMRTILRQVFQDPAFELQDIFEPELVLFSYELGCSKPNPLPFERACRQLANRRIAPDEAVYIGNHMLNDVWAARNAGLKAILFGGEKSQLLLCTEDSRCAGLLPDAIVIHPSDISRLLTAK